MRLARDAALAVLYVALMATAVVQEVPHEYLGVVLFALVVAHVVVNRRWFTTTTRGRYDALRVLRSLAIVGSLATTVALVVSSLVISKYVFGFLPAIPRASLARKAHILCSHWGFVCTFAHAGLQFPGARGLLRRVLGTKPSPSTALVGRIACVVVSFYGAYSFVQLNIAGYLTGQIPFALVDYDMPLVLSFAQYGAVAVLIMGTFHCIGVCVHGRRGPER